MQGTKNSKISLEKEDVRGCTVPNFKAYYNRVIKRVWYFPKDRHVDQYNKIGSLEISVSHTFTSGDFDKGAETFQLSEERRVFPTSDAETTKHLHAQA